MLYVTLKDAGLSDENAVAKLPDVASATLRRGRLTVTFGEPERKEEVPFMANKNTDYRALAAAIVEASVARRTLPAACTVSLGFVSTSKTLKNPRVLRRSVLSPAQWAA